MVDASQGVEAQTLANVYHALDANHEIVPVLNKVDLPAAEPERVKQQIEDVIGLDASDALEISAKTGLGVPDVLEAIVKRLPPPKGDRDAPLKALLVDSWYDPYLGVVVLVRVIDGVLKKGQRIRMMGTGAAYEVDRVGVFTPKLTPVDELGPGEIGFITASIKEVADTRVGDTITDERKPARRAAARLPAGACRWCSAACSRSMPPTSRTCAPPWASSASTTPASPSRWRPRAALGFGFRCGFLGLLHLEIIQERLEREFNLDLIATAPSVVYKINLTRRQQIELHNPVDMPDVVQDRAKSKEPWIKATILTPDEYLGAVLKLCQDRRGVQKRADLCRHPRHGQIRPAAQRSGVRLLRPAEVGVEGLRLVRLSRSPTTEGDLVKMSILVNDEPVDALSMLVHRTRAETRGRGMCEKLKELIPPHMFQMPIQAAIGGKIIARETVRALRKDVTAKCYGGDATRKRKLLDKQKKGKKKMRQFGKVEIPQEAFIAALKVDGRGRTA